MRGGTVEVPAGLALLGAACIACNAVLGLALCLLLAPVLTIWRRQAAWFDDWNAALKAPWLFWHIGGMWYRFAELLGNYVLPAPQRVADLASAYFRSQVVITLTELGVPDALATGPKTGSQLAAQLRVHGPYLARVLRAAERLKLVAIVPAAAAAALPSSSSGTPQLQEQQQQQRQGVMAQEEGEVAYRLTQLSAVLTEGHVNSVKHMVLLFGEHYAPFGRLAEGVRRGTAPYRLWSGGLGHWEHMGKQPELYTAFNKAMTNFNNLCPIEAVFLEVDFTRFARLVDVGGGLGALTAAALTAAPHLQGHLFDLPNVISQAQQAWRQERSGLLPRMAFSAGSFFEPGQVPRATSDADVFTMRQILHDWSDAECVTILKQVRGAIGAFSGARLLIVECCLADGLMTTTHTPRLLGDVHMLAVYGDAGERTQAQFGALLGAAGFRLARILPTKSLFFVLEAVPV